MSKIKNYNSKSLRQDFRLLRNDFKAVGKWQIPIIKKCEINIAGIELIPSDHVRIEAPINDISKTVHFFVEDDKLERYYQKPENYIRRLAQYQHVLTPDYSLYIDMPLTLQLYNTFRSRWCGAYWQYHQLSVIPTISWGETDSFEFCFLGIEFESVVAISTLGCLKSKESFLKGYFEMKKRINPKQVLCFGKAFSELGPEVINVSYNKASRRTE